MSFSMSHKSERLKGEESSQFEHTRLSPTNGREEGLAMEIEM